ncbi:hypothetical protein GCM10022225_61500 [Plantactinospora mayteni]|uniref:Uncharacterized protein n=1 Tax=Plantactinospora mayteni TaxID=566021 RepID=A0ABQ4EZQ1_9ACTN|nr:hypothetical protein Pma05_66800 [Plantactinospora mayteni]
MPHPKSTNTWLTPNRCSERDDGAMANSPEPCWVNLDHQTRNTVLLDALAQALRRRRRSQADVDLPPELENTLARQSA